MPTTKVKNLIYRLALPVKGPGPLRPEIRVEGRRLTHPEAFARLMRKHRVLGAGTLLAAGEEKSVITCSLKKPERAIRRDSLFRVASITKMATALAALSAAQDGKLSLEGPVNDVFLSAGLPAAPELDGVTLKQLLSHTSGLADPPDLETSLLAGKAFPEVLPGCRADAPGAAFRYSNLGFGLVGCLLEAVDGLPVSESLDRRVFRPLGMRATLDASSVAEERIVPICRVLPYAPSRQLTVTPLGRIPLKAPDPLRHFGHTAGAMYADTESLEKLLRCLRAEGEPVLRPGGAGRLMISRQASYGAASPALHYGLGVLIIEDASLSPGRILGHQGFAYGCADGAFWEEETGRMIVFLNGGASEARRRGRLGTCNEEMLRWAFRKEMPAWSGSVR
ncbi:MAG: beta-lactamase family protein [Clostridia bacterium]|nr:beta-lactamase family protein [Clostridia bacterium]